MEKTMILLSLLAFASVAFAERQPYERYETIVTRQMFGPLPPGFDPTKMASEVSKTDQKQLSQEQEKLKSSIHFSVINVTPDGSTAVGFTDKSDPKTPIHYYLKVGEERNGWKVKEADAVEATMTIAKGEIEVSLKIGGDSSKDADATMKKTSDTGRRPNGLLGSTPLGARRRQREEAKAAKEKADQQAAAEREAERQARDDEEKAQREQERNEQRQQLQAIQEELKRVREAKAAEKKDEEPSDSGTEAE